MSYFATQGRIPARPAGSKRPWSADSWYYRKWGNEEKRPAPCGILHAEELGITGFAGASQGADGINRGAFLECSPHADYARRTPGSLNQWGKNMAKMKKAFGRLISKWKEEAAAANPGASDQDLANIINDMAQKQGFDYAITPDKVRVKAKAPARKRATAPPQATVSAPADHNSHLAAAAPAPRKAEGQLLADLRSFVQLVGKDAARSLLNDMVDRL